ncbi:hypothetical protein DFH08DRAFT_814068 [Mycena albidolilacea]|uniref:Uncharacterized protein n=1 Tax=Mycena albidolilacea TaxID=1033008 RepID=A0AAD6ZQJ1_9AGAR|nr:hypothetical protein DFH08DRAFT_814068 [Mycena albidolilacea]
MCGDFPSHITMKTIALKAITAALSQLPQLNYLNLLPTDVEFTETLRNGHFPNLSTLLYTSYWSARTIGSHSSVESQDLHWLRLFVSAFGPDDSSTIASVFLLWYGDDLDVEAPLLHLGKIALPDELMAIFTSDPLEASTILGGVATHLPRIKMIVLSLLASYPDELQRLNHDILGTPGEACLAPNVDPILKLCEPGTVTVGHDKPLVALENIDPGTNSILSGILNP